MKCNLPLGLDNAFLLLIIFGRSSGFASCTYAFALKICKMLNLSPTLIMRKGNLPFNISLFPLFFYFCFCSTKENSISNNSGHTHLSANRSSHAHAHVSIRTQTHTPWHIHKTERYVCSRNKKIKQRLAIDRSVMVLFYYYFSRNENTQNLI